MPEKVIMKSISRILLVLFYCLFIVLPALASEDDSCSELIKGFLLAEPSGESPIVNLPKSNQYTYQYDTDNQVSVAWQDSALRAFSRECDKAAFRGKLETEIARLEKFEELSGKDPSSWVYREIIIEIINKKVVPELGIVEISFSNPETIEDSVSITVSLKSVCGYTVAYDIDAGSLSVKGARISK